MIKLYSYLRSFILNIQNKNYNYKLKQIRMIIIDGLLSQPINRGHSLTNTNTLINPNIIHRNTNKKHKKAMSTLSTLPSMTTSSQISIDCNYININDTFNNKKHKKPKKKRKKQYQNDQTISYTNNTIPTLPTHTKLPIHLFKNKHNNIWRAHITDHDENGNQQYDLLLCTLKYSLISTTIDLYNNEQLLDINHDKLYLYIKNKQQKQSLSYLFSCFFNYMGNYTEYMSLKCFESGLKKCGISFDRHEIIIISFGQLSKAFTGSGSKHYIHNNNNQYKKSKLFITQNSFVQWLLKTIYSKKNTNYKNYDSHYHQYYKWIENDLFSCVNPNSNNHKIRKKHHSSSSNHHKKHRHKSHNYHNPVIIPKNKKKQKKFSLYIFCVLIIFMGIKNVFISVLYRYKKRRHKSHQIQIHHDQHQNQHHNNYSDII